jgi:hypothetical protein
MYLADGFSAYHVESDGGHDALQSREITAKMIVGWLHEWRKENNRFSNVLRTEIKEYQRWCDQFRNGPHASLVHDDPELHMMKVQYLIRDFLMYLRGTSYRSS